MGNCQAIDAATIVIQKPSGKVERLNWVVSANEIMKNNPGHYVALLISTTISTSKHMNNINDIQPNSVRVTRIKLLRPTDTLVLGQVYRLITTQEVLRGLLAKKEARMKKNKLESADSDAATKATTQEVGGKKDTSQYRSSNATRSRAWQPALNSILETPS